MPHAARGHPSRNTPGDAHASAFHRWPRDKNGKLCVARALPVSAGFFALWKAIDISSDSYPTVGLPGPRDRESNTAMPRAILTINSKNYGSWSLRGWLLCKMAGLAFDERMMSSDDPTTRAELLLLSPSFLVPCLTDGPVKVWDTLAIAEYLNALKPDAGVLPKQR